MKKVYMAVSTDIIHSGHINIINKASELGDLTVGIMTDKAISEYKNIPFLSYESRKKIFENIRGVNKVIPQKKFSYRENLELIKPDIVVHGDDWITGPQSKIRQEVIDTLNKWGGELVEYPYNEEDDIKDLENIMDRIGTTPDVRRKSLKKKLELKENLRVLEAHNGLTGLIVEKTKVEKEGITKEFDAIWISSLCDSTAKGKPDIELVDFTSRINTINDILEVTTKPIILDGDTGGKVEHFVYTVKTLERLGVSAIIIEDKVGLKKNSLFGTDVLQQQDSVENFCNKIHEGKKAQITKEFMIIARIESLILEAGMEDAIKRAKAYVDAGADGIMIHSRKKKPDEIFEFCERFKKEKLNVPIVVVPTSYSQVTEEEMVKYGINIVIYANHLIRSAFPAMQSTARKILLHDRAKEASEENCMSIGEILTLIPGGK